MTELRLCAYEWNTENAETVATDYDFSGESSQSLGYLASNLHDLGRALISDAPEQQALERGIEALYITYTAFCSEVHPDIKAAEDWQRDIIDALSNNATRYTRGLLKDTIVTQITPQYLEATGVIESDALGQLNHMVDRLLGGIRGDIDPYYVNLNPVDTKIHLTDVAQAYQRLLVDLTGIAEIDADLDSGQAISLLEEAFDLASAKLHLAIEREGRFRFESSTTERAKALVCSDRASVVGRKLKMLADVLSVSEDDEE